MKSWSERLVAGLKNWRSRNNDTGADATSGVQSPADTSPDSIAVIRNPKPLFLLDLRYEGASLLGISTDTVRAKAQAAGRRLSQEIYDQTEFDGIIYMSRITNKECVAVYDRAVHLNLETDAPALNLTRLSSLTDILRSCSSL